MVQGLRILVAEDNLLQAERVQRVLHGAGYDVIGPAARLDEARYVARQEEPDGALLDICLAGVNCFAGARCLLDRHVPFAFISGATRACSFQARAGCGRFPTLPSR